MFWTKDERRFWIEMPLPGIRTIFSGECVSPIGTISTANYLRHSRALPASPMRVYGRFAMVYLIDGNGIYRDATGFRQHVSAGNIIWVYSELPHTYGPRGNEHWTELHIHFNGPLLDLLRHSRLLRPDCPVDFAAPINDWLDRFELLLGTLQGDNPAQASNSALQFAQMITEIVTANATEPSEPDAVSWLRTAKALIENRLDQVLDSHAVASECGVSYDHFRKTFRAATGQTPTEFHLAKRINAACELLTSTRMTSKQIAETLGFSDEYHFSRRFLEKTGKRPGSFRSQERR